MNDKDTVPIHQTLDQERAKAAWGLVKTAKESLKKNFVKYQTLVKRFPALVNHNGLGQTIAFLLAKGKDNNAEEHLLAQLSQWLMQSDKHENLTCYVPPYSGRYQSRTLVECITRNDSRSYIQATREALTFLDYLRRFADGMSKGDTQREE
jgi:CRISPR-associated protein Cmr5